MSNGWRIFWTSVYYPFAVRLLSDVSNDNCSCALFVHWNIYAQIVNQTFVHKQLTNILDVSLLSVCAQRVDKYFGRPFAVRLCTNGWPIYRNKKEKKINENQESNTLEECKQFSQEKKIHTSDSKRTANGQQTIVRCFSAQTVAWADIYPFAVQTSDILLLSVCCSKFLLCTSSFFIEEIILIRPNKA